MASNRIRERHRQICRPQSRPFRTPEIETTSTTIRKMAATADFVYNFTNCKHEQRQLQNGGSLPESRSLRRGGPPCHGRRERKERTEGVGAEWQLRGRWGGVGGNRTTGFVRGGSRPSHRGSGHHGHPRSEVRD